MSVCRYFNTPKGCRNNPCRFLHQNSGEAPGPTAISNPSFKGKAKGRPPPPQLSAPPGICRYYYTYGNCKLNDCKFRHIEPGEHTGLSIRHGEKVFLVNSPTDAHKPTITKSVSPSDALQHLTTFCTPRLDFKRPFQLNMFVNLLANAGSGEDAWTAQDATKFLEMATEPHGLSRIEAVLKYPTVVVRVEGRRDAISFTSTYITCLSYFVSEPVMDSSLQQRVNALYGLLHSNYARFDEVTSECMTDIVSRRSFNNSPNGTASSVKVFDTLTILLIEYLTRYKSAIREYESLVPLVDHLLQWFLTWKSGGFEDGWVYESEHSRKVTIDRLDSQMKKLSSIMQRETASISRKNAFADNGLTPSPEARRRREMALLGPLEIRYEPAGSLREEGPRHDNDFEDIRSISIPPTESEMLCPISPFLPANIPGAPHHLQVDSMERLLDIQFRLLREELLAPLRIAIQTMVVDLRNLTPKSSLYPILEKGGGRYVVSKNERDTVMVNLYTSVNPLGIVTDKRGISISIRMDTPPGSARNASATKRTDYWKAVSRKRLMQGGLAGLVWEDRGRIELFFGLISSSADDIQASARQETNRLQLRLNCFDPAVNLRVMTWCQMDTRDRLSSRILLAEAPVMYESIRPFLQALQREPTSFPFSHHLVHRSGVNAHTIPPPQYTITRTDFSWNLSSLFDGEHPQVLMNPHDKASIDLARHQLHSDSRLDPSQADAMVDCLTQELCLIQGPPGTGKSFTGIEIMRILLANNVGRILLIAFTNHALDHLLGSVLDKGITKKIVRLGSRSSDERIAPFSIENLERLSPTTNRDSVKQAYRTVKDCEKELKKVLEQLQGGDVPEEERSEYLTMFYPDHLDELLHPPTWIQIIRDERVGWTMAGHNNEEAQSEYDFWISGGDLQWLDAQAAVQEVKKEKSMNNRFQMLSVEGMPLDGTEDDHSESDFDKWDIINSSEESEEEEEHALKEFLERAGLRRLPLMPDTNRPLDEIRSDPAVWLMSIQERSRLSHHWKESTRQYFFDRKRESFAYVKTKYEEAREAYAECQSQVRLDMLSKVDIIGCTTTGAAKLTKFLKGIKPSVLLVEEAGQVLEAHILGSLVQSIQHIIMIGDPLQLRPTINNYELSMDHPRGEKIYKFDQSTMERLDASGVPMSRLTVQRRMRPAISAIPRATLYQYLKDHMSVEIYPHVRGMGKDMFFFHHTHEEGGAEEESMSKYNTFEIQMIAELVRHLLRQGVYARPGSIAVLCMYLGQLAKLRDALRTSKINVALDSRDEEELRNREGDAEPVDVHAQVELSEVRVTDQVLLRTVDNFQGEEADIVLLSLVRNPGQNKAGAIGFLKSSNRANVALTRAKHGLYVFGNGDLLASKNEMWRTVIEEFKEQDCYGPSLPISCYRHAEEQQWVSDPSRLRQVSPDGGCLRPCEYRLKCGHTCPSKCHADDPDHLFIKCYEACRKACPKGHPCNRLCYESCARCRFPVPQLVLGCGHVLFNAPCYMEEDRSTYQCMALVERTLPNCGHSATLPCYQDITTHRCLHICGKTMSCCQKSCQGRCSDCQALSSDPGKRDIHKGHACGRILHCQHPCTELCTVGHQDECGYKDCHAPCRQSCIHHRCTLGCSTPCTPCAMPCPWKCPHQICSVPCGSPCVRLPCDLRCSNNLSCGHPCPSLCGEPCGQQACIICASPDEKEKVVDLILGMTLGDVDASSNGLDNIIITLSCRHSFTVETLDGICELNKSYQRNESTQTWVRPILPDEGFIKTPCCPTCRQPIDARRYGRVTKRGNLDLLERNVATRMARGIGGIHRSLANFKRENLENRMEEAFKVDESFTLSPKAFETTEATRCRLLETKANIFLPVQLFGKGISTICGLSRAESQIWADIVKPLLRIYDRAIRLASTRTAHVSAYEASFSMLYQEELRSALQTEQPSPQPEVSALLLAKTKVGMTPPRADTRFQVEAIWIMIDVRVMLASLAEKVFSRLSKEPNTSHQANVWARLISFIYDSCLRDADLAHSIATRSKAQRQMLLSRLRTLKSNWRSVRFEVIRRQTQTQFGKEQRKELIDFATGELERVRLEAQRIREDYRQSGNLARAVVQEMFDLPLYECFRHWEDLISSLNIPETFYQPVSEDELREVVGSFREYHSQRGHWYTCPNGHIFTIADCGGAVMTGICNECGETIGGAEHQTVPGVQRADEVEHIAT